jgi:hypothetical protein
VKDSTFGEGTENFSDFEQSQSVPVRHSGKGRSYSVKLWEVNKVKR